MVRGLPIFGWHVCCRDEPGKSLAFSGLSEGGGFSREGFYSLIVAQATCGLLAGGCGRRKGVAGRDAGGPRGRRADGSITAAYVTPEG